ncbi:MAG: PHP domain-containing protein, partial [Chloroflexota bacterium]
LAEAGTLPTLVEVGDIKGDFHVHTEASDGHESIEEMALAAQARGYEYIAITDHSVGLGVARGLSLDRLRQQVAEIKELRQRLGIHIFTGMELDIRADGSLDFPDEVLREVEVVVASVHSSMLQEQEKMTARVLKALDNPYIHILGHPSCRLLGVRDPVQLDWEAVFQRAAQKGKVLEINAMPQRLDLKDIHAYRARELGVKLVISTDAHSAAQLDLINYGVGVVRRGWCQPSDVINTWPLEKIKAFLAKNGE